MDSVKIYRITHIDNVPHILKYGITHKNSLNRNPNFKDIGDISLIGTRNDMQVIVDNGQLASAERKTISLGDFIPFYFGVRMPMLYVIQHGGNFVVKATKATDIVYLVCSINKVVLNGNDYYFSDGHATDILTSFYDQSQINKLIGIIDWDAIRSAYWGGSENLNLKRKKQAEFLVMGDLPPNLIIGVGCYDIKSKDKLISMGVLENIIKIIPKAYY